MQFCCVEVLLEDDTERKVEHIEFATIDTEAAGGTGHTGWYSFEVNDLTVFVVWR